MKDFLLLTLAAPLASFGGLAVGERRPSADHPTKSQTVGLVASALGIPRADDAMQTALAAALGYAVKVDDTGLLASDYHTADAPKDASVRRRVKSHGPLSTRRDELDCDDIKTTLSAREYRAGVLATVVLWLRQPGPATLEKIRDAFLAPSFCVYLGRKAFPLMLPLRPALVSADTIEDAIAHYRQSRSEALRAFESDWLDRRLPRRASRPMLFADADAPTRLATLRTSTRRDQPETRAKWRFGLRTELALMLPLDGGDS